MCVYRQCRFVNKLSECSVYFFFLGFREFRIFETHYFYNTCLDPEFFFYLDLPGGGGGPRHFFGNFTV